VSNGRTQKASTQLPNLISNINALKPDSNEDTHKHSFKGTFSGTTWVSRYQKGKTNLDFTEARDSEWQWHQLGRMKVCTSLQTDNHASTPPLESLQAGCPSCRPNNTIKALKTEQNESNADNYRIQAETTQKRQLSLPRAAA